MKVRFLLLLPLLIGARPSAPPAVRVTFSPLTKAAYLQAKKGCIETKPHVTFPLKKTHGRIIIPTAKGQKAFQDKGIGTDNDDQAQYEYLGYLPQFECHVVLAHLWERTLWILIQKSGRQIELYDAPSYSPDLKSFVVISSGLEYSVYPNSIRLFQFDNHAWQEVWSLEPKNWEPYRLCWASNSSLLLIKEMWVGKNPGTAFTYSKLLLN
jgi:hypothetical protein